MSALLQIGLVLGVCLLGEMVSAVLPVPVPSGVTSMLILFALLCLRVLKPKKIEGISSFLLSNMAIFFVPSCVGVIRYVDVFFANALPIVVICVLSTPVVFFMTGMAVKLTMRLMCRKEGAKHA